MTIRLLAPSLDLLPQYTEALQCGWSPTTSRPLESIREELRQIADDPASFVASLDDPEAKGAAITLPDGSSVPRLPGFRRWIFDGEFCGAVNFRWQHGTSALPAYVLGHIGYLVVPWKRGRGYAGQALKLILPDARKLGLIHVELTADSNNIASQKTILACGGILIERFMKSEAYGKSGNTEMLRYRIYLDGADQEPG